MMNADELRAAHAAQDWRTLWEQSVPIVKYSIKLLMKAGRLSRNSISDDLLQEGYEAAGRAVRSWNPDIGKFSPWISQAARSAMLNHLRREAGGMVGGRDAVALTTQWVDDVAADAEADTPFQEVERSVDALRVRIALTALEPNEQLVIKRYFGVDCAPEPMDAICKMSGLSRRSAWRIIREALERMSELV